MQAQGSVAENRREMTVQGQIGVRGVRVLLSQTTTILMNRDLWNDQMSRLGC